MKKLIIFGISDAAQLAHYYFSTDSNYEVVAFAVDTKFLPPDRIFCNLPVVAFEGIEKLYAPRSYAFFVALGYSELNQIRKNKFFAAKALGYEMVSYVSSRAIILNSGKIGENCFILENNVVQPFVEIGDNVTLWSGNHIGHHSIIESHCFVTSHAVISGRVHVCESCFIGVNATLRDRIRVGERSIIGAGSLILNDVAAEGVYMGHESERSRVPSSRLKKI